MLTALVCASRAKADALNGLTASQAAQLTTTAIPVVLPSRVPDGYRIYGVRAEPTEFEVVYANGTSSFVVKSISATDLNNERKLFKLTGDTRRSAVFGSYRVAEGTSLGYSVGCYSNVPSVLRLAKALYEFTACGSLGASALGDVIGSAARVSSFHASGPTSAPDAALAAFTPSQQRALRVLPMPVALLGAVPHGFTVASVTTHAERAPGGVSYDVVYANGRSTIHVNGSSSGFGSGDVPAQKFRVPVHSKLFGETVLIVNPDHSGCLMEPDLLMLSLKPGYSVDGCNVPPYVLKRAIESVRLIRPL